MKKILKSLKKKINDILLKEDALPLFKIKKKYNLVSGISLYSFGKLHKNKIFYIIRRSPGAGLFSNVIYVLNQIKIAELNNFIPIIDMQNFTTIYNEKKKINGTFNAWEYYFEKINKYTLDEVYKSKNVVISGNNFSKLFSHNINNNDFRNLFKKFIKIDKRLILKSSLIFKKYSNKKILAIHYRGTSYKTSANHPYPATIQQTLDYTSYLIKKHSYDKIFLCTEDLNCFKEMKKKFKSKIFFINSYRSKKDDAFKIYPRKNHRYKLGYEIFLEALIISKCHGFLHAITNVSMFVRFLDKKKKINYHVLNNGINTSNEFLAPYMWNIKNLLNENLGGFKKKIY